jgi:hypothetical protein
MSISRNVVITGVQWDQVAFTDCGHFLKAVRYETFGSTEILPNNKFNVPSKLMFSNAQSPLQKHGTLNYIALS